MQPTADEWLKQAAAMKTQLQYFISQASSLPHPEQRSSAAMTSASQLTSRELLQHFIVLPRILQKDFEHIKVKKEHNIQINIIILNNR